MVQSTDLPSSIVFVSVAILVGTCPGLLYQARANSLQLPQVLAHQGSRLHPFLGGCPWLMGDDCPGDSWK